MQSSAGPAGEDDAFQRFPFSGSRNKVRIAAEVTYGCLDRYYIGRISLRSLIPFLLISSIGSAFGSDLALVMALVLPQFFKPIESHFSLEVFEEVQEVIFWLVA